MNRTNALLTRLLSSSMLTIAGSFLCPAAALASGTPHLSVAVPGGMPGTPIITSITRQSNQVTLTWDGPSGKYQVFQKSSVVGATWQAVGPRTNTSRTITMTVPADSAFFKVSGPTPAYGGTQLCTECHEPTRNQVAQTAHPDAFQLLVWSNQATNAACLPCHTVGHGTISGFKNVSTTPELAGVQCESCHGPAANHAAYPEDLVVRPRVELAGTVCGGCHDTQAVPAEAASYHPPYYTEWKNSAHAEVLPELQADFTGPAGASTYIPSCGGCHSGSVRQALLSGTPLPDGTEAGAIGITCATCHDPHALHATTNVVDHTVSTNQLRYPVASLQDYHTSGSFATNYNPQISVCGQCHNDRNASWKTTSRPPHHSPQYNMLLGTVGVLDTDTRPNQPAAHGTELSKQCVTCHMQTSHGETTSAGHSFTVDTFNACLDCHPLPEDLVFFTQGAIATQIQDVKGLLDQWALTKAPAALRETYGALAWEYTTPGTLSAGTKGPTTAEQGQIPDSIKQARFNLYIVYHDGSYGVHNGPFAVELLDKARTLVAQALNN